MSMFEVWLWLRLDIIHDTFVIVFGLSITALTILSVFLGFLSFPDPFCEFKEQTERVKNGIKRVALIALIISPFAFLVPSTKEAAVIYILPKIVNNQDVKEIPELGLKILMEKLRELERGITKTKGENI